MLYEFFRVRNDAVLIRWIFVLSGLYILMLGLFMVTGDQHVSAGAFWLTMTIAGIVMSVIVFNKLRPTKNRMLWKLQRITGSFLLPMVTGHMMFMHLNYKAGHDVDMILTRMSNMGMKTLDFMFVLTVFFHAGFGLTTIIGDYVEDPRLRTALTMLNVFMMMVFALAGIKLVASVSL
jgi:succinate dehydrogenase hydrophobic membrane anchor protein